MLSPEDRLSTALLYAVATLIIAIASWHLFERPINGLKRRFPTS
jgi:peptidoglycan/LPS O-acetylase OafA/YrhL